ncbi:MAG: hypothetical protein LLG04_06540 [Parachlamydia sp.]|nr:hypothetical protein [Parachlamydia sp.]
MTHFFLTAIFVLFATTAQAQESDLDERFFQDEKELLYHNMETHAVSRVELMQLFWELQIEALAETINAQEVRDLKLLESAELNKTKKMSYRYSVLEKFQKQAGLERRPYTGRRVAFLGDSANPFLQNGFDPEVLGQLLDRIKAQRPEALFFTGNLIWSLELPQNGKKEDVVKLAPVRDQLGNVAYQPAGTYDSGHFRERLKRFAAFVKRRLGDIPLYPVLGEAEAAGPDSLQIFLEQFPVPNSTIIDSSQLVYNVSLGNADFVVLSLAAYDKANKTLLQHRMTSPLLQWVDETLAAQASSHTYLFAVGNEPAFSPEGLFKSYAGDDRSGRMRFWHLLMRHHVVAYFCSNQPVFDRTYRYGVWQILSGGGGAELDFEHEDKRAFYHYLLLTIPQQGAPMLQVFDQRGRKRDELLFSKRLPAVMHFRE